MLLSFQKSLNRVLGYFFLILCSSTSRRLKKHLPLNSKRYGKFAVTKRADVQGC